MNGSKALDVGSGSGYLAATMAHMVGPQGRVYGIEHIPELVEMSKENISKNVWKLAYIILKFGSI